MWTRELRVFLGAKSKLRSWRAIEKEEFWTWKLLIQVNIEVLHLHD